MNKEQKTELIRILIDQYIEKKDWERAIEKFIELDELVDNNEHYKQLGQSLAAINHGEEAMIYLKDYLANHQDDRTINGIIGEILVKVCEKDEEAIDYLEAQAKYELINPALFNMLGHLYFKVYSENKIDKQLYWFNRAHQVLPHDVTIMNNLALTYAKDNNIEKADEFFEKVANHKDVDADQLHAYGAYLVNHQRFTKGFKYLQYRWQKKKGNFKLDLPIYKDKERQIDFDQSIPDLSDKTLLVMWEQGFGDTVLFSRFIGKAASMCKKLIFITQGLISKLIKYSIQRDNIEVYGHEMVDKVKYDYWLPTFDLPLLVGIETAKDIPFKSGYLKVDEYDVEEYKEKHLKNLDKSKLNIGITYQGTAASEITNRDIKLETLMPLLKNKNVQIYSFQVEDRYNQIFSLPKEYRPIDLSKTFKTWYDTACAVQNMDLMLCTDNGVMNLSGALGKKTIGLFNKLPEFRWFGLPNNTGWYDSIIPYQCKATDQWDEVIQRIIVNLHI